MRADMTEQDASTEQRPGGEDPRLEHAEERFAIPVLVAAIVSVPAVFLTTLEDPAETIGQLLNWASLVVLTGETVVLFILARDRRRWLREHWFVAAVAVVTVPAVIFAVGPVQLLRLVRFVGALRILRVGRILKAGRILSRRAGFTGWWRNAIAFGISLLAAAFVALILADDTSDSREFVDEILGYVGLEVGLWLALAAAAILAVATFIVLRDRSHASDPSKPDRPDDGLR